MNTNNPIIITLLFIGALIAFIPLIIVGFIYTTIKHLIKRDYSFSKQFFPIFHNLALVLDGLANAIAGELLNDFLLKRWSDGSLQIGTYKYGKWYDTVSEVTGVNEERGKLNERGELLTKFLSVVLNSNHSISAINRNRAYKGITLEEKQET